MQLHGHALLSLARDDRDLVNTFAWRRCHTLALVPMGEVLTLVGVLYGSEPLVIGVCTDRSLWQSRLRDGGLDYANLERPSLSKSR